MAQIEHKYGEQDIGRALEGEIKTRDPWEYRGNGMKCATCIWFVEKKSNLKIGMIGRCRRHSPSMAGYPVVYANDWCGDHKVDENK